MDKENDLKVGDLVEVNDPGLKMLRDIMEKSGETMNNHYGKVSEIWDNGETVLVDFPIGDDIPEEHSQTAPYPRHMVRKREE